MSVLVSSPVFGVILSLIAFEIGLFIQRKTRISFLNPLLIALILIIMFLKGFNISLEDFNKGGQIITFLLGPATVVLAVPLYKNIELLKKNALPIIGGIVAGSTVGIGSIIIMSKLWKVDLVLGLSLIPKSVTMPIGIEVAKQIGGIPEITVAAIIVTGLTGAMASEAIFKALKIKDPVAMGIAIGTSAHALGTTKAIEMGEIHGAMSGLAIGIAGLLTVLLAPLMIFILNYQ